MLRYLAAGALNGILFGLLDGVINGNPLAQRLFEAYRPISRQSVNIIAGLVVDLVFGFIFAGIFLLLQKSLPGKFWFLKGVSFGLILWFLRVATYVASQWLMFKIPFPALLYTLGSGLVEMMILGLVSSFVLRR